MHPLKKEFIALVTASGLSQADIARLLHLTRGGINGIVTGDTVPSQATVRLLKLALMAEKPELFRPDGKSSSISESTEAYPPDAWANELVSELRQLEDKDRDALILGLRAIVRAWPRKRQGK